MSPLLSLPKNDPSAPRLSSVVARYFAFPLTDGLGLSGFLHTYTF